MFLGHRITQRTFWNDFVCPRPKSAFEWVGDVVQFYGWRQLGIQDKHLSPGKSFLDAVGAQAPSRPSNVLFLPSGPEG